MNIENRPFISVKSKLTEKVKTGTNYTRINHTCKHLVAKLIKIHVL